MNRLTFVAVSSLLVLCSCSNKDVYDEAAVEQKENANVVPDVDIAEVSDFKMTQAYTVPTQAGKVTVLTRGNDTLAVTDHAISINIPKTASIVNGMVSKAKATRSAMPDSAANADINKIVVRYQDVDSLSGYRPGSSITNDETIMMFEDSPVNCDYDYNDVVLLVKCKTTKQSDGTKLVNVAVKPLACGAQYNIKFGFDYEGQTSTTGNETKTSMAKSILLSSNVKKDFFNDGNRNTTGTYSSVITLKDYTIAQPFNPAISYIDDSIACVKFDRKSYQLKNEDKSIDTITVNNEGFYQFAPIKFSSTDNLDAIKFFIAPEIPLTYTKNSTYKMNGTTLTGKIKYTSIFTYKLYAGDCNLKAASLIPYGIAIPVTAITANGNIFWPYEGQPIWAGFTIFKNWLSSGNNGSWINTFNESDSFVSNGLTWNAKLLVRGASTSEMVLPSVEEYAAKVLEVVEAKKKSQETPKVEETITNAEQ